MAQFGAKYPCFLPDEKTKGIVIGKLVTANLTVTNATGEFFADDVLAEQVSEFSSGSLAMETDDLFDEVAAEVYGATVDNKVVTYKTGDNAPSGVLGYYKVLMRSRKKFFKGYVYPCVRAALGNDNAQTKGSSISFTPISTTFTVMADDDGVWRKTQTFDTEDDVREWIEKECGINQTPRTVSRGNAAGAPSRAQPDS